MSCIQTTRVLAHTVHCDMAMCSTQGCETTKKLMLHFQQCHYAQSRGLVPGITTTSSSPFNPSKCMICSIACSSSPTKVLAPHHRHSSIVGSNANSSSSSSSSGIALRQMRSEDEEDVMREDEDNEYSFASDEVIQFNRIPFQNNQIEARRPQAYSADGFAIPTGAPRGVTKARSKSMNAMSVDEFAVA